MLLYAVSGWWSGHLVLRLQDGMLPVQGWQAFEQHVAAEERSDLVAAYHKRLTSPDPAIRDAAVCFSISKICAGWLVHTERLQLGRLC